ncbi:pseudouridine synthase [Flavihumibacter petaseus]|uniref:Pseudouridine synthase n=1 Tax=Flavihumibacter petaseus NBRC 106054 TaxID=1220578 RepID=A0A0E9MUU8_9BACT|nr:pseudouridine synthase [Flavihumibacter petaseus]GAO41522.1 putative 23S rRNA pseudouridine synthase [Flavihumibacter petaseus NBRC 106054]
MKKPTGFEKFANKKKAGTVKESHRKEKREFKKEISREMAAKKSASRGISARDSQKPSTPAGRAKPATTAEKETGPRKTITRKGVAESKPARSGAQDQPEKENTAAAGLMPLNKFIAHAGVCARRDAAAMVKTGVVEVNGKTITEPGFKVTTKDTVKVNGKKITPTRNFVYILLNKPKDFLTTTDDPHGRKTVLDLIKTATTERVYPIGRLDRNTSGVLLLTNDGEMAQSLSHPKNQVRKIYEVRLDKPLTKADFDAIANGITLEDGVIIPDALGYADPRDKTIIGIEIHSGRNRIVRRIFEHLKYDVKSLDRVMYAGLTKKNVNRGKWRFLTDKELRLLKHFNH